MSADVWLELNGVEVEGSDTNITYNLSPMLHEAGFPGHRAMVGAPATEAGGVYADTARRLRANPDRFRRMNPENGWGTYEFAVDFCDRMAASCSQHPGAVIGAWL